MSVECDDILVVTKEGVFLKKQSSKKAKLFDQYTVEAQLIVLCVGARESCRNTHGYGLNEQFSIKIGFNH